MSEAKMVSTLASLFEEFSTEIYVLRTTGDMDDTMYEYFLDYLLSNNEIPYGVAKARDGDPYEFVYDYIMSGYKA